MRWTKQQRQGRKQPISTRSLSLGSGHFEVDDGCGTITIKESKLQRGVSGDTYISLAETVTSSFDGDISSDEQSVRSRDPVEVVLTDPDIYGQRHPIESDALISYKLQQFSDEVGNLKKDEKTSLVKAVQLCSELLTEEFKLMFLRCECFNAKKAAARYAKYWNKREEIFGEKRAFAPLTFESMKPDMAAINTRTLEIIRQDDDRDMLWYDPSLLDPALYSRESVCRALFYVFHQLLQDTRMQQRGLVVISKVSLIPREKQDPTSFRMNVSCVQGCLPIRLSAFHGNQLPSIYNVVVKFVLCILGERLRKRILLHPTQKFADILESTYNISRDCVPIEMGGTRESNFDAWLQQQKRS